MFTSTLIRYAPAVKTASRRVDILDQHRATRRPVARPELNAVGAVVGSEKEFVTEQGEATRIPASRRVDVLDHATRRPVARPELPPVSSVSSKEKESHGGQLVGRLPSFRSLGSTALQL